MPCIRSRDSSCDITFHAGFRFIYQLGAPLRAEYWIYEARVVKHLLLERATEPKIVFVAGSSGLFGIDSASVAQETGMRTINMSIHADLPPDFTLREVQEYLTPGDIVVLALEFEQYTTREPYQSWFTHQVMTWNPEYFGRLGTYEKMKFFASVSVQRIVAGVLGQAFREHLNGLSKRSLKTSDQIWDEVTRSWNQIDFRSDYVYSFLNLNGHGDAILNERRPIKTYDYELNRDLVDADYIWRVLAEFSRECRARQVKMFVAWPPSMKSDALNFDSSLVLRHMNAIVERLTAIGIPVLGHPKEL